MAEEKNTITAEEILNILFLFFIKKPKGILILFGIVAAIVGILYFSSIRAQNSILIDSLKVLQSTAQISDTINKKVRDIEIKADVATKEIDERIQRLDEVEKRFQTKREEIRKLREEQDVLLKELSEKLGEANKKLDQIDEHQVIQQKQGEKFLKMYEQKIGTK